MSSILFEINFGTSSDNLLIQLIVVIVSVLFGFMINYVPHIMGRVRICVNTCTVSMKTKMNVTAYRAITDNINNAEKTSIEIDFELHDTSINNYFCLQTAPYDNLGRIINEAKIEGLLDNYSLNTNIIGNSYLMDGIRYLIKGFFRFGSSGAPYVIFDQQKKYSKQMLSKVRRDLYK